MPRYMVSLYHQWHQYYLRVSCLGCVPFADMGSDLVHAKL